MTYNPKFPYNGEQIIFNSDRISLNSKTDSIFLFSSKAISFSSNEGIHFNTNNMIINSDIIKLGLDAVEPLVKGNQLEFFHNKLLNDLEAMGNQLYIATDSNGNAIPAVQISGNILLKSTKRLKNLLKKINSSQNFTL